MLEALLVEPAHQRACIAVAKVALGARRFCKLLDGGLSNPARTIAAARKPDCVERRIVGRLHKRLQPRRIVAGEMPGAEKALRVENDLGRAIEEAVGGERLNALGQGRLDARAGRNHANTERRGHERSCVLAGRQRFSS